MKNGLRLVQLLYLLRVPLSVCGFQIGLVIAVHAAPGIKGLLGGVFDLQPGGLFTVSTLTLLLVSVETVTSEIVLRYCQSRFRLPRLPDTWESSRSLGPLCVRTVTLWLLILYLIGAAFLIGQALALSTRISLLGKAAYALGGGGAAIVLIAATAFLWQRTPQAPGVHRFLLFLFPAMKADPEGYLFFHIQQPGRELIYEDRILPVHVFAATLALVWLLIYAVLGLLGDPSAPNYWVRTFAAPALGSVLILLTVLCLVFGSLAFWLDRYRIPCITPILLISMIASWCPRSDHTFHTEPVDPVVGLSPQCVVEATQPSGVSGVVVVATSGGGIHAAAWTTTVLAGLTRAAATLPGGPASFPRAVRLISSVSGGSVGSLYFTAAYRNGAIPLDSLQSQVIDPPRASSLDAVAWGVVYPDLLRLLLVFPPHMNSGWALEKVWARNIPLPTRLSDWRPSVRPKFHLAIGTICLI
ncbi:hypothetical protein [uncultured Paludibaculum sp.]|uniref:hypothetical protein n=1 Tax=uncultured Paludibaculum sp. TaxID=1765020 RepID=UPI002AAC172D|nr:hypothetical protein [uncultured Paludibaculum sp.]